jgi:hypothetical protein
MERIGLTENTEGRFQSVYGNLLPMRKERCKDKTKRKEELRDYLAFHGTNLHKNKKGAYTPSSSYYF